MCNDEWINLFNGRNLNGWRIVRFSNERRSYLSKHFPNWEPEGWMVARSVSLHPDDPSRFLIHSGEGILINGQSGHTQDLATESSYGDCELHIEFVVPERSNSGVYLMGHYEIQILDSWGETELKFSSCGGIYARYINGQEVGGKPPRVNASRPPGEWQSYDVIFRAPKFDDTGRKISNAVFERVVWNGVVVHENVEVE